MHGKQILDRSGFLHQAVHLILVRLSQLRINVVHLIFHIIQKIECRLEHTLDCHALFQCGVLIQITHADVFRPLDLTLIRHQLAGNDIHKRRFSLAVGTDKSNVLPLQQPKGHILENRTISKSM